MIEKVLLPTQDLVFKKLFASNQHKEILRGFIQDFFGIPIQEVIIKNPYSIQEFNKVVKKKRGLYFVEVDTLCIAENNWSFHIEMQVHPQRCYLQRSLYYLCSNYLSTYGQEDLMAGKNKYSALRSSFSISILGFDLFKEDTKAAHLFTLYDEKNQQKLRTPNLLTLGYFELRKPEVEHKNLKLWQSLFLSGEAAAEAPAYIQQAADALKISNFSKEERKLIDALEKFTQDRIAREEYVEMQGIEKGLLQGIEKGLLQGRKEGLLRGRKEEKLNSAFNMIRDLQISVTKAIEIVDLPEELWDVLVAQLEKEKIVYSR